MRFLLFVEGKTERMALAEFLKRWLDSRLTHRPGIQTVKFDGAGDFVSNIARKAQLHFDSSRGAEIVGIIGLLDLYGFPSFPTTARTVEERYQWARQDLEHRVNQPKFRQFFAVHETEAWLLSKPAIFPSGVRQAIGSIQNPETVNFAQPPALLLDRSYRNRTGKTYKKAVDGRELFSRLDPNDAYLKCSKLKELLDEMLRMATEAGL